MAITDFESAKAWLEGPDRTLEEIRAIAARSAMRALPGIGTADIATIGDLALPVLRAMLTSGVASKIPTPEVMEAAHSAARSAFSAHSAAHSAALSAAFSAVQKDAEAILADNDPFQAPLWPDGGAPDFFSEPFEVLQTFWKTDPKIWDFWARWYDGMLKGDPMAWELQEAVALIDKEVWEEGAAAVADEIARIEALYRTNVTPRLKRIGNGRWDVEQSPIIPDEPLEFAVDSVEQSLRTTLKLCSKNLFNETSDEAIIISDALDRYQGNPSLLAVSFWQACMSFQKRLGTEYPKDDTNLVGLQNTLYTSIEEMCEHSEVIRIRIGRLAALTPRAELTADDQADLQKLPEETAEHLTQQAQKELLEAVEAVKDTTKSARTWKARLANWVTTLGKGLDEGQRHDKRAKWLLDLGRRLMKVFFPVDDPEE